MRTDLIQNMQGEKKHDEKTANKLRGFFGLEIALNKCTFFLRDNLTY